MLTILHSSLRLPARALVTESTTSPPAWRGIHTTVELVHPVEALRLASAPIGAGSEWFALGDWIETPGALPQAPDGDGATGYDAIVTLAPGTVLNVGLGGPMVPDADEEVYAELIRGPVSKVRPLDGWWGPQPE